MEKVIQDKISAGYKQIMWGVLLTAAHIQVPIFGRDFQILPIFIGYIMIAMGLNKLCNDVKIEYFKDAFKSAKMLVVVSIVYWIWSAFIFPYTNVLTGCFEILVFILEISVIGDFLNKTVKLLKENDKIKLADKTRKNRMNYIKFFLGVVVVYALALIPKLVLIKSYAAPTLMLSVKIFLSLMVQNVARCQVIYDPARNSEVVKESEVEDNVINS